MDVDFRGLQERLRQRLLVEIREGRLTGLQLAREVGFRQSHISNFLNSKRGLSLEAMDAVLKTRGWKLADLLPEYTNIRQRRRSLQANSPGVSWIPLVDAENCYASEIPYEAMTNALRVMSSRLEKAAPVRPGSRDHWVRFVAIRVSAENAEAMAPRLTRGAMVIVDRHAYAPERRSVYAVRGTTPTSAKAAEDEAPALRSGAPRSRIVMRYMERVGRDWVMRAENSAVALVSVSDAAEIVGRVCMVISET